MSFSMYTLVFDLCCNYIVLLFRNGKQQYELMLINDSRFLYEDVFCPLWSYGRCKMYFKTCQNI